MAKELWDKLEAKYMKKRVENKLYLRKKLFCFDYKEGISMAEHLVLTKSSLICSILMLRLMTRTRRCCY